MSNNIPEIKIGVVAVSRDCFPAPLAVNRRKAVMEAYVKKYGSEGIYECPITIVESEIDMINALEDVKKNGCNALCVYLGNFGPEIAETLLAKHFDGPVMFSAAAEESQNTLGITGRGDAYCGMLNASYNLAIRNTKAWIPENPVRDAEGVADNIHGFIPIARVKYGLEHLKIITFGPRPQNFLACNAPIRQLYNFNIEIEEESELDLFEAYEKHYCPEKYNLSAEIIQKQNAHIAEIKADMMKELGMDSASISEKQSAMLDKFAAYEATLVDWIDEHIGYRKYVALATKCWHEAPCRGCSHADGQHGNKGWHRHRPVLSCVSRHQHGFSLASRRIYVLTRVAPRCCREKHPYSSAPSLSYASCAVSPRSAMSRHSASPLA